jgi:hypothetical protein
MADSGADQIQELHRELNAPGRVPEKYYRRNTAEYELVSYLASMVALWTSGNLLVLQLFLSRASEALERLRPNLETGYAEFVDRYLRVMARYLSASSDLSVDVKAGLPRRLLDEPS